jgi:hypothetical protein
MGDYAGLDTTQENQMIGTYPYTDLNTGHLMYSAESHKEFSENLNFPDVQKRIHQYIINTAVSGDSVFK